jgi:uncharacterized membrane protein
MTDRKQLDGKDIASWILIILGLIVALYGFADLVMTKDGSPAPVVIGTMCATMGIVLRRAGAKPKGDTPDAD